MNATSPPAPDKLLLVDDDALSRTITRLSLEGRGFEVIEAETGLDALRAVARHRPDIVLLDALMQGMDGFATCRALRATPAGAHLPILMLTGLDDEESISRAYEAGASDFFVKSVQWTLLAERVRYLLRASRTQVALARSESRIAKAQRIAGLGIWEWNLGARMVTGSAECWQLLGREEEPGGIALPAIWRIIHPDDRAGVRSALQRIQTGHSAGHFDIRMLRPDGGLRIVRLDAELERDADGKPVKLHGITQDITDRREAEERIRNLANFDGLTGLANRHLFRDQLSAAIELAGRHGHMVAVLFVNLDNFKRINETLGQTLGDTLLREVASRLYGCVRTSDRVRRGGREPVDGPAIRTADAIARIGGDEFTLLLDAIERPDDAETVAARVLIALQKPILLDGQECFVSASIGIAVYPRDGAEVETVLRNADLAMQAAKDAGRNGIRQYAPQLDSARHRRLQLSNALHKAIERDELRLHYQPQVDIASGQVVAAEALMRWQQGERLVPPDEFIPIASETGLILPMGDWAINEACRQIARWRESGQKVMPIAVNVSANAFQSDHFVDKVTTSLQRWQVEPYLLEIEITETMLMQEIDVTLPILEALTATGVKLSVDDFGTGYSSLSYLRKLPLDTLKIDRSFVRDLQQGADDEAIVAAIAALARALGLRVIAEGVETVAQANLLKLHGCQIMQGFLFARPMAIDAFDEFVRTARMPQLDPTPARGRIVSLPRRAA